METHSQDTRLFQRSFLKVSLNTSGLDGGCGAALGCCGAALSSLLQVLVSQTGSQDTVRFTICSDRDGSVSLGETSAAAAPGLLRADIVAGRCFGLLRAPSCWRSGKLARHTPQSRCSIDVWRLVVPWLVMCSVIPVRASRWSLRSDFTCAGSAFTV